MRRKVINKLVRSREITALKEVQKELGKDREEARRGEKEE